MTESRLATADHSIAPGTNNPERPGWRRIAAGLILFGIAFGFVEASVVVYLRNLYEPIRRQIRPNVPALDAFPLITLDQLHSVAPERLQLAGLEVTREAATIAMLAAVAMVAVRGKGTWLPAFAIAFGVWDIFYYIFLHVILGWPTSLLTWDILFLIPVPWAAPVLAPVIVAASIVMAGLLGLRRRVCLKTWQWIGILAGCVAILASFMWDAPNLLAGGYPHPFLWSLFFIGELLSAGSFLTAYRQPCE